MLVQPWLTSSRAVPLLPSRAVLPYRAYVMASSSELFPAPVGPVMANKSSSEKCNSECWRKLVNPCISSLIGRISHLQFQRMEGIQNFLRRLKPSGLPEEISKVLMQRLAP